MLTVRLGRWLACVLVAMAPVMVAGQEAATLPPQQQIGGFDDWTTSVAISPDGKTLAIGSYDVVKLWDLDSKAERATLDTRCGYAQCLTFTADSSNLLVGGYQQLQVWSMQTLKRDAVLKGHKGYIRDLAFGPDGMRLATACEDRTVRIWNLQDRKEVRQVGPLEYPVLGVAWSPDGRLIATAEGDETRLTKPGPVQLWNAESGELVRALSPHEKGSTDVTFSPDGTRLLSTGLDEHVNVYDLADGKALGFFGGHSRPTNCVLYSADGRFAISGSGGRFKGKNEIKLFQPEDGRELVTLDRHEGKVTSLALSPDGKRLVSASQDQNVIVWDLSPVLAALSNEADDAESQTAVLNQTATEPAQADQQAQDNNTAEQVTMRIGIIGLDTSHAVAFSKLLNAEDPQPPFAGCRIVAAYPKGSPDIESSVSRVPGYTEEVQKLGVEIVDSIDELVSRVDAVFLETNDGRPHLEQVLPVLKARKPVFVDKPIAASLVDAIAILDAARYYGTPCFSASSLRWIGQGKEVRNGDYGAVVGADTYSPCSLEATHPDLYWYGIHGVEGLFAVMGTGLKTVSRTSTENFEQVTGVWEDGRIGTFRGLRTGARGYGGTAFCEKKTITLGPYPGYQPLVESIIHFFRTGEAPVAAEETLEIYLFMTAADESKQAEGKPVSVAEIRAAAQKGAEAKLQRLIPDYAPRP
ncbi:MAG: Gfo/Idh/MocA family oxidoreductase [Planctomycetaceae bacterium]|nr:Gfo/Idh/MocA family oxidoreductase [Planctomycetaceae bacterium]